MVRSNDESAVQRWWHDEIELSVPASRSPSVAIDGRTVSLIRAGAGVRIADGAARAASISPSAGAMRVRVNSTERFGIYISAMRSDGAGDDV